MLRYLQNNMSDLDGLNQQLASGKQFHRPSQAPIEVAKSMQFESIIENNEQYKSNVDQARNWLTASEDAIASEMKVLQRARELANYGANDTLTADDRKNLAQEVKQLRDELVNIANSKLGNKYLFSGQATDKKAIVISSDPTQYAEYQGDYNKIYREINPSIKLSINVNAAQVFKEGIEETHQLYKALDNGENSEVIANSITELDSVIDNNLGIRAKIGAKVNRLDMTKNRLKDEIINMKELLSENEDIDIAEVITDLKMKESVYRASLASGARVMQPTLVDFLQ